MSQRSRDRQLNMFIEGHKKGWRPPAMTWECIEWLAREAIGQEDADSWIESVQDLLQHPNFIKDPCPQMQCAIDGRMKNKHPHTKGRFWVSPHPERLGYYQFFKDNRHIEDVFGDNHARKWLYRASL